MKFRAWLFALGGVVWSLIPLVAYAQIVPCGSRTGEFMNGVDVGAISCDLCHVGQLFQNIINFLVGFSIPVAILAFGIAGWFMFTSGQSPTRLEKGKKIFGSVLIGFLVVVSGWLIVQTILSVLVKDTFFIGSSWDNLDCDHSGARFDRATQSVTTVFRQIFNPLPAQVTCDQPGYVPVNGVCTYGRDTIAPTYTPAALGTGNCSASSIQAAAGRGGYLLNNKQANTLSCIAGPESGCSGNPGIPTTLEGKRTSARGHFQIALGYNDQCHNLNLSVCTQAARAARYTVSGNLNCSQYFSGGSCKPGQKQGCDMCEAAAANFDCNTSAAACLVVQNPEYTDWTQDPRASTQRQCVKTYN